jgi:hypothetical protein
MARARTTKGASKEPNPTPPPRPTPPTRAGKREQCCPAPADRVILSLAGPIVPDNATFRAFRRLRADGASLPSEFVAPLGYAIPKGRGLVVTDLAYYSAFTKPDPEGTLRRLSLGSVQTSPGGGLGQRLVFMTTPIFSKNRAIGGNVSINTGFVIPHGCFLSCNLDNIELVSTELFVYGFLVDL